jgi:hypothetical protein
MTTSGCSVVIDSKYVAMFFGIPVAPERTLLQRVLPLRTRFSS